MNGCDLERREVGVGDTREFGAWRRRDLELWEDSGIYCEDKRHCMMELSGVALFCFVFVIFKNCLSYQN